MTFNEAIEQAGGLFITNGDKVLRVQDKMFWDLNCNQVCITTTDETFLDNWRNM